MSPQLVTSGAQSPVKFSKAAAVKIAMVEPTSATTNKNQSESRAFMDRTSALLAYVCNGSKANAVHQKGGGAVRSISTRVSWPI